MILDKPLDTQKRSRILFILGPTDEFKVLMETAYEPEVLAKAMEKLFQKEGNSDEQILLWNNPVPPNPQEQMGIPKSRIFFYVISTPPSGLVIAGSGPASRMPR